MKKAGMRNRSRNGVDRRAFLARCAGAVALSGVASRAFADDPLDALMDDGRAGQFGQDFDQASRTIHMPKPTAPMLSPATEQFTQKAIAAYDEIVARGGWPTVPSCRRVAGRQPPSERGRSAATAVAVRRPRSQCGRSRKRHLRLIRRSCGAAFSGAPRRHRRWRAARLDARGAQRAGGDAARSAQGQYRAAQDH